jgi:oxygen-independent coproporphyrinogen-3 oxidase
LKYWTGLPFLGVGCGAHSYDGRARWFNFLKTEAYIERIRSGEDAVAEHRELAGEERAADALFMGLRLKEGINLTEFSNEYGVDVLERFGDELPRLTEAGLLRLADGRLALTGCGRLLSNEVFVSFL